MNDRYVGIWIDHDRAQLVEPKDGRKPVSTIIESFAEPRHRTTGQTGVPLPGHLGCNTESHDRNRRAQQLTRFYDHVIEALPANAQLVIVGPGVAKTDLWKRIRRRPSLAARVLSVQTSPKLSVNQIAAEVRKVAVGS